MESSLGSNFKSWSRQTFDISKHIYSTIKDRVTQYNQTTNNLTRKLASSSREGAKKKDVSENRFEIATRVMLDNAFECL